MSVNPAETEAPQDDRATFEDAREALAAAVADEQPAGQEPAPAPDAPDAPAAAATDQDTAPAATPAPAAEAPEVKELRAELKRLRDTYGHNLERARQQAAEEARRQLAQEREPTPQTDAEREIARKEARLDLEALLLERGIAGSDADLARTRLELRFEREDKERLAQEREQATSRQQQTEQEQQRHAFEQGLAQERERFVPEELTSYAGFIAEETGADREAVAAFMTRKAERERAADVWEATRRTGNAALWVRYLNTLSDDFMEHQQQQAQRREETAAANRAADVAAGANRQARGAAGGARKDPETLEEASRALQDLFASGQLAAR